METIFYLVNVNKLPEDNGSVASMTDEEFICESQKQHLVYSIGGFEESFNQEEINTDYMFLRIITN